MEEQKINLIIVDDNKEFCNILRDYLLMQNDIVVTGIAENGLEALKLIKEKKPDLIILDIIMPILDGLGVLERLNSMGLDPMPHIIILSAVGQDKIAQRALSLGADHYVIKPFDMEIFIRKIRECSNDIVKKTPPAHLDNSEVKFNISQPIDMITQITNIIDQIGVPSHKKGYMFLREAINMVVSNVGLLSEVTNDLYPLIGKKYNTTASRVELAILHAIADAWSIGQVEFIDNIFGYSINNGKGKPTNSEFIAIVANKLKVIN